MSLVVADPELLECFTGRFDALEVLHRVATEGQDFEALEALQVCDVADHVGGERKLFAVDEEVKRAIHFLDRRVNPDQFDLSEISDQDQAVQNKILTCKIFLVVIFSAK